MVDTLVNGPARVAFNGIPRSTIHELRTPLTSIRGYAQLLLRGARNEQQARRAYETMFRESQRLSSILDRLSDVAEVMIGSTPLHPVRVDLQSAAVESAAAARDRWPSHRIIHSYGMGPKVIIDPHSLRNLIAILLDNAACFSQPGSTIETSVRTEDGCGYLAISDQGIGIPADELEAVFECFIRASNAATAGQAASSGLGIGLFLARSAVQRAAGEIWAESELKRGSTFQFGLPLAR